jgi:hypothetical protein
MPVKIYEYFCDCPFQHGKTPDMMNSEISQDVCTYPGNECAISILFKIVQDFIADWRKDKESVPALIDVLVKAGLEDIVEKKL